MVWVLAAKLAAKGAQVAYDNYQQQKTSQLRTEQACVAADQARLLEARALVLLPVSSSGVRSRLWGR